VTPAARGAQVVDGPELRFRFDFRSANGVRRLHPFVSNGQLTLLQDRSTAPPAAAAAGPPGLVAGRCTNAVDGKLVKPGDRVSNGDPPNTMEVPAAGGEAQLALFVGSTLFAQIPVRDGAFSAAVPAGRCGPAPPPPLCACFTPAFSAAVCRRDRDEAAPHPRLTPALRPPPPGAPAAGQVRRDRADAAPPFHAFHAQFAPAASHRDAPAAAGTA
jgi:hypothetical protein